MTELHRTLTRQLVRLGLSADEAPDVHAWQELLRRVSRAYQQSADDRYLLKRSVQVVTEEMGELNAALKARAEDRVAFERDQLFAIINALSDGFCLLDPEGRLQRWNPASEVLLGSLTDGQEVLPAFRFSPALLERCGAAGPEELLQQVLTGSQLHDDEAVVATSESPVALSLFPVDSSNGSVIGVGVTFRDISARVHAEVTLRRLAKAVDASADAIYITTPDGTIEYVNAAFTALTGWQPAEVVGQNPRVLKSGRTSADTYQRMWATLRQGRVWNGRLVNTRRVARPDGSWDFADYWAQSTIAPYFTESGALLGYVALQRDITELVRSEESARAESLAGRVRVDAAAALQGPTPLADRVRHLLRVLADDFSNYGGGPWTAGLYIDTTEDGRDRDLSFGPAGTSWRARVDAAIGPDWSVLAEKCHFGPDVGNAPEGAPSGILVPLDAEGALSGYLAVFTEAGFRRHHALRDAMMSVSDMVGLAIAEERARRAAERARQAAEDAARAKSQFLANMSHEIRTPMNGVLGMLDLLATTTLDHQQSEYVSVAQSSAESLLTVINDILDFSRIEAGKVHIEHIDFDLVDLVEDVTALFAGQAAARGVELACFLPPGMPAQVVGDPTRLRQVLSNLIGNAVKFTREGEIAVKVELAEKDAVAPTASASDQASAHPLGDDSMVLTFSVTDTGIGIPASSLEGIFDSFAQADSTTTRRFGGTGLGLAISKQLVGLMGGNIWVTSTEGAGTTFAFHLPVGVVPAQPAHLPNVETLHGAVALVVDDNATNRLVLATYLAAMGIRADLAENGLQAWEMLTIAAQAGTTYPVALIDLQMPGLDGAALARRMAADARLATCARVLVTSAGLETEEPAGPLFHRTLHKPVRQGLVHAVVRDLLLPQAEAARPVAARAATGSLRGRVLLVEDNVVNRRVGEGMLRKLGLDVDAAADGRIAVDMLAEDRYDVVQMDCQMPVMDGFEATREWRRCEPEGMHTPVIALTADAMAGTEELCLQAGMDAYLTKPYSLDGLFNALLPWLPEPRETGRPYSQAR